VARGATALHANRAELNHLVRVRHQQRHNPERLATEVLIQPCHDDRLARIRQLHAQAHQLLVEKLRLLDGDDLRVGVQMAQQLARIAHGDGFPLHAVVRRDGSVREAVIQRVLKHLHLLAGVHRAAHQAYQLLRLAREHAAANHG